MHTRVRAPDLIRLMLFQFFPIYYFNVLLTLSFSISFGKIFRKMMLNAYYSEEFIL